MSTPELDYLARRSEREAVIAAATANSHVAAVHEELSRRYAARLLAGLAARTRG